MTYLRYLLSIVLIAGSLQMVKAQVSVGVGVGPVVVSTPYYGFDPAYPSAEPFCEWGYYSYYPYDCAPYGYYGPDWFVGGIFIGVGPWHGHNWGWGHGWGHPSDRYIGAHPEYRGRVGNPRGNGGNHGNSSHENNGYHGTGGHSNGGNHGHR